MIKETLININLLEMLAERRMNLTWSNIQLFLTRSYFSSGYKVAWGLSC